MPLAPAAVGQNKTHTKDQLSVCDSEFRKEASRPRSAPDRPKSWPRKRPGMDPHIPPRAPDAVRGRAEEQPPMGKNVRSWRVGQPGGHRRENSIMRQPTPAHMPNRCSDRTIDGLSHPPITTITDCRRIHGASLHLEPNLDDIRVPHHSAGSATAVHIGVARCDQRISQRHRPALRLPGQAKHRLSARHGSQACRSP